MLTLLEKFKVWWYNLWHFDTQRCPACGKMMQCIGFTPHTSYHECHNPDCTERDILHDKH
jgi:hypothetical protein